jgi:hypothetical protein
MSRAIVALVLLLLITAALQIGGSLLETEAPGLPCSFCH